MSFNETSYWLILRIFKTFGLLPIEVNSKTAERSNFHSKYFTIITIIITGFILYADKTFDASHLHDKNPIIWKMILYQTRISSLIGVWCAYNIHKERDLLVEMMNYFQDFSVEIQQLNLKVEYKKRDIKNWMELGSVAVLCCTFAVGFCIIIHPFHGSLWEQLKCGVVRM